MLTIFKFDSYKDFLKALIKANSSERGYQAQLARTVGCQPSYLSQVLSTKAELNQDHILALAHNLGFDDQETEFILLLLLKNRSLTSASQNYFEVQLTKLKKARLRLTNRLGKGEAYSERFEAIYHSSWVFAAVHVSTSIPGQTEVTLAENLQLPIQEVRRVLKILESFKLVKVAGNKWEYAGGASHLSDESFMTDVNHSQWRQKSLANLTLRNSEDLRYTSVFTLSREDVEKIKEDILKVIQRWRKSISPSASESAHALLLDFFEV